MIKEYYIFIKDLFFDLFDERLSYYASSLSWNTIFSIIPILAILFSIFTSLPVYDSVYDKVHDMIFRNLMPTESKEVMEYVDSFVSNSGNLGLMGSFYVLFASVMFFSNYDFVINDIFETPKRNFKNGVQTYLALMITLPILFGTSFYLSSIMQSYLNQSSITSIVHIYMFLPFFLIWGVFYLAYQVSPNKSVSKQASISSSFISSLIWYSAKSGFVFYVLHNHTYSSIYGSISILLFFFLWIYISWVIFLHGLKFCYILDKNNTSTGI